MKQLLSPSKRWLPLLGMLAVAGATASENLLPPEQAFRAQARMLDRKTTEVRFAIAPGYYLYRKRFQVELIGKAVPGAQIKFPKGRIKEDPTFGRVETYEGSLTFRFRSGAVNAGEAVGLKVISQGCAEKEGVCFPPFTQSFKLTSETKEWVSAQHDSVGSFAASPPTNRFIQRP